MKKKDSFKQDLGFYIDIASKLSSDFEVQYREIGSLGDYGTVDIATEWIFEDHKRGLNNLLKEGAINQKIVCEIKNISKNFKHVSDGKAYDSVIWTLEGLKTHPFWEKQRCLAKELLIDLKRINTEGPD